MRYMKVYQIKEQKLKMRKEIEYQINKTNKNNIILVEEYFN